MRKEVVPSSKLYCGLLYPLLIVMVVEGISWLGIEAINILLPETEIIPRTAQIFDKQSRSIEQLLQSQREGSKSILLLDPDLGWRFREGYESLGNKTNNQGVRGNREYARVAATGVTTIAVFGDSFAYGSEVLNTEAWSS